MKSTTCISIHRMKYSQGRRANQNDSETRAMIAFRFHAMYRNLGLTRPDVAKLLHVSERTLHNWESGHHEIPYSAYKLLRLLTSQELPGKAWAGWHVTAGVLWSPEGHGFKPLDMNWWSLLCRRAAVFHDLYAENLHLRSLLGAVRQPPTVRRGALAPLRAGATGALPGEAGRAAKPSGPNLLLEHFRKYINATALVSLVKPVTFDLSQIVTIPCYENEGGQS